MLLSLLIASLPQGNGLAEIERTLKAAVDRAGFENGAYQAARNLASIPGEEAMELRLRMFDPRLETYQGVFLRDWFYSGMQKAATAGEAEMLLDVARSSSSSDLLKLLSLRALRHSSAPLPHKALFSKSLISAPGPLRREWQSLLGEAYAAQRIQFPSLAEGEKDEKVRKGLMTSGPPWAGHAFLPALTGREEKKLKDSALREKDTGDRSQAIRTLALHPESRGAWMEAALAALSSPRWGPRTATLESAREAGIHGAIPLIIEALASQDEGGRWPGDLADALHGLTGNQFGPDPVLWSRWWKEQGAAFLEKVRDSKGETNTAKKADRNASASFFGIPVDSNSLVILVDGSGSMKMDKLGDRTCAEAAIDEIGRLLEKLPPKTFVNLALISTRPLPAFKKSKRNGAQTKKQAVAFLRKSDFRGTSSLVDVLLWAQNLEGVDTILLVSDGGSSSGRHQYSEHMLDTLLAEHERMGVRIHGICVGPDDRKASFMRKLAESTGGRVVRPSG